MRNSENEYGAQRKRKPEAERRPLKGGVESGEHIAEKFLGGLVGLVLLLSFFLDHNLGVQLFPGRAS